VLGGRRGAEGIHEENDPGTRVGRRTYGAFPVNRDGKMPKSAEPLRPEKRRNHEETVGLCKLLSKRPTNQTSGKGEHPGG